MRCTNVRTCPISIIGSEQSHTLFGCWIAPLQHWMGKMLGKGRVHLTKGTFLDYWQLRRSEETYPGICLDPKTRAYSKFIGFIKKPSVSRDYICVAGQADNNFMQVQLPGFPLVDVAKYPRLRQHGT